MRWSRSLTKATSRTASGRLAALYPLLATTLTACWLRAGLAAGSASTIRTEALSRPPSYPPGTTGLVLESWLIIGAGLVFLVVLNRWINLRAEQHSAASLAKEARRLKRLTIGYPEGMKIFEALRSQGWLEKKLTPLGMAVIWKTYPSASSLLSDLHRGAIDFCGGGGTASLFAQAAGQLFVRVAREKYPELEAEAILVPQESSIQDLSDLRHRKIAFDEGSSAHYVLVRALEKAGIDEGEIETVLLPQESALPLFVRGELDAWVVWMPYAANEQRRSYRGRSIGNLRSILGDRAGSEVPTLYYATPELVRDNPRILKAVLEELNEAGVAVNQDRFRVSLEEARERNSNPMELEILEQRLLERALLPLDEPTLNNLQRQAQLLHQRHWLPVRVNVWDGTYSLRMRQNWTA